MQDWARRLVEKQQLAVIGITGSVGKTTAKEAIAAVLSGDRPVFQNRANYNGLYGLPIALSEIAAGRTASPCWRWRRTTSAKSAADRHRPPPHRGRDDRRAGAPGDIRQPGSHRAREGELVAALPPDGLAVLNADDARVAAMAQIAPGRVLTYGTGTPPPDGVAPTSAQATWSPGRDGVAFTVDTPAGPPPGAHPAARPAPGLRRARRGRGRVWRRGSTWTTIVARLAAMPRVPGPAQPAARPARQPASSTTPIPPARRRRKPRSRRSTRSKAGARSRCWATWSSWAISRPRATSRSAARPRGIVDLLVTRGNRARRIAEAARDAGLPADRVVATYTAEDAARAVLADLGPGDVVLVKGSLATRMEQVVRLLMADPRAAEERLVRQDAAWQSTVTLFPDRPTWLEIDHGRHRAQRAAAGRAGRRPAAADLAQGGRLRARRGAGGADRAAQRRVVAGRRHPERGRRPAAGGHPGARAGPGLHPGVAGPRCAPPRADADRLQHGGRPRAFTGRAGAGQAGAGPRQGRHRHGPAGHLPRGGRRVRAGDSRACPGSSSRASSRICPSPTAAPSGSGRTPRNSCASSTRSWPRSGRGMRFRWYTASTPPACSTRRSAFWPRRPLGRHTLVRAGHRSLRARTRPPASAARPTSGPRWPGRPRSRRSRRCRRAATSATARPTRRRAAADRGDPGGLCGRLPPCAAELGRGAGPRPRARPSSAG